MLIQRTRMFIVTGCMVVAMATIASAQRPQTTAKKSGGCCTAAINTSYDRVAGISRSYINHVGKNSYTRTAGIGTNVGRISGVGTMGFKDTARRKYNTSFAGINSGVDRNAGINTYTRNSAIGTSYGRTEGINVGCRVYKPRRR